MENAMKIRISLPETQLGNRERKTAKYRTEDLTRQTMQATLHTIRKTELGCCSSH